VCALKKPLGDRKAFKVALVTFGTPATIRKSTKLYGVYTVLGGAEGNRTPDLCSAIAELSIVRAIKTNHQQLKAIESIGVLYLLFMQKL
jgi:hypothetical protein